MTARDLERRRIELARRAGLFEDILLQISGGRWMRLCSGSNSTGMGYKHAARNEAYEGRYALSRALDQRRGQL